MVSLPHLAHMSTRLTATLVLLRGHFVPEGTPSQSMARSTHGAQAIKNTNIADRYRTVSWYVAHPISTVDNYSLRINKRRRYHGTGG